MEPLAVPRAIQREFVIGSTPRDRTPDRRGIGARRVIPKLKRRETEFRPLFFERYPVGFFLGVARFLWGFPFAAS